MAARSVDPTVTTPMFSANPWKSVPSYATTKRTRWSVVDQTSSMRAIGALSPWRVPIFRMRVYPPERAA
jgi:hypothetical protein